MKPRTVFLTMSLLGCAVIIGTGFAAYYDDENNYLIGDIAMTPPPSGDNLYIESNIKEVSLNLGQGKREDVENNLVGITCYNGDDIVTSLPFDVGANDDAVFDTLTISYRLTLTLESVRDCPITKYLTLGESVFDGVLSKSKKIVVPLSFHYVDKPTTYEEYEVMMNDFINSDKAFKISVDVDFTYQDFEI